MSAQDREQAEAVKIRYEFHREAIGRLRPAMMVSLGLNVLFALTIFVAYVTHPERRYYASLLTGEVVALSPLLRAGN